MTFQHVSRRVKFVLCGRQNIFATFSEDALHFSWQAQRFGDLRCHVAWQGRCFRGGVVLRVFCESHCQGCPTVVTITTPHSTLHTLDPASSTTLFTLRHFTLHTFNFKHNTFHFTLHILRLHFTLHTSHPTLDTPHFTLYTPHLTLYTPHFTLHTLHFLLHTLHSTLDTLSFPLHTLHFTLYTLHPVLYALHFTVHT